MDYIYTTPTSTTAALASGKQSVEADTEERKPKEPPTLKSLMQEYEAIFRQYRLENRDDYDLDATVAYRMADIANDVRGFIKAGGDDYAVMQMAAELDYFKELIEREKAKR